MDYRYTQLFTSIGIIVVHAYQNRLTHLYFADQKAIHIDMQIYQPDDTYSLFLLLSSQLSEYLQGIRISFDIPYMFDGATPFQQKVWQALNSIPYGATISYQVLATRLGAPTSTRAVAATITRNPLLLLIPCHRVIGSNGGLVGYAGGLDRKKKLLSIEDRKRI